MRRAMLIALALFCPLLAGNDAFAVDIDLTGLFEVPDEWRMTWAFIPQLLAAAAVLFVYIVAGMWVLDRFAPRSKVAWSIFFWAGFIFMVVSGAAILWPSVGSFLLATFCAFAACDGFNARSCDAQAGNQQQRYEMRA